MGSSPIFGSEIMLKSSHMIRVEEKKARKRLVGSLLLLLIIGFILIVGGIPLFTKFSLLLTSGGRDNTDNSGQSNSLPLLPPHLEPVEEATNSDKINIRGYANPGETVQLVVNDRSLDKLLVGNDGKFLASDIMLDEGENKVSAKVIKNDKESSPSDKLTIVYKKTPPNLDISEPNDNQNYFGDSKKAKVSGKTDPDTKVTINDRLEIVNNDGTFNDTIALNEGDNQIKIVAIDAAGNQTTINRKVTYKP